MQPIHLRLLQRPNETDVQTIDDLCPAEIRSSQEESLQHFYSRETHLQVRFQVLFTVLDHSGTHIHCRRSNGAGMKSTRMSTRSLRGPTHSREGNFVRSSLQMQSRDFEQLCEFMMRVNPFYDSSEGWRESSDEEDSPPLQPMSAQVRKLERK